MIYLLDHQLTDDSHSRYMLDIIKNHSATEVKIVEIPINPSYRQLYQVLREINELVMKDDVILVPWAVDADDKLDMMFSELTKKCWVVVAAGNNSTLINGYSPSRVTDVITVGCLNKSGNKATLSNYSENKILQWIPGTNYNVGWFNSSGTSISAAIYAAFLMEAIKKDELTLIQSMIDELKVKVRKELNYSD